MQLLLYSTIQYFSTIMLSNLILIKSLQKKLIENILYQQNHLKLFQKALNFYSFLVIDTILKVTERKKNKKPVAIMQT